MFQHQVAISREFINNKGSISPTHFQELFALTSTLKVKSLIILKLQITHQQVYVHIATTPPHIASNVTHFQPIILPGLCAQTTAPKHNQKVSHPAEVYDVSLVRLQSI
jgi:hypothetical protein